MTSSLEKQQISNSGRFNRIDPTLNPETKLFKDDDPPPTISLLWDEAVQEATLMTAPGPTIASCAYAMVHTAIYDAWSAYDPLAIGTQLGDDLQCPQSENTVAIKSEAMSFAAYRVLSELFPEQLDIFNELWLNLVMSLTTVLSIRLLLLALVMSPLKHY